MLRGVPDIVSRRIRSGVFSQNEFNKIIEGIWRNAGQPDTMGIALSGGADSMALTQLCDRARQSRRDTRGRLTGPKDYYAFIVDHKARPGSAEEAKAVQRDVTAKTSKQVNTFVVGR